MPTLPMPTSPLSFAEIRARAAATADRVLAVTDVSYVGPGAASQAFHRTHLREWMRGTIATLLRLQQPVTAEALGECLWFNEQVSPSRLATYCAKEALRALAAAGEVICDLDGRWSLPRAADEAAASALARAA